MKTDQLSVPVPQGSFQNNARCYAARRKGGGRWTPMEYVICFIGTQTLRHGSGGHNLGVGVRVAPIVRELCTRGTRERVPGCGI